MPIGVLATIASFLLWGLFPLYFRALGSVPPFEILAHRMVWSLVFISLTLLICRRTAWLRNALTSPKILGTFFLSSALIAVNWGAFVYAVGVNRTIESSLGYFINPLLSVALGSLVFREKLRPRQKIAVALATVGVVWITIRTGEVPYLGLLLAGSFALYGMIRKLAPLGSLEGLALESLLLTPWALAYMGWLHMHGNFAFAAADWDIRALLILAGPVTLVPLLLYAFGVRRISLSSTGIIQYISPTMQFLVGLFVFGEAFSKDRFIGFVLIWTAVALFAFDSLRHAAARRKAADEAAAAAD